MAKVIAFADGSVSDVFQTWQAALLPINAGALIAPLMVDLDESTNAALISDVQTNRNQYAITLVNSIPTLQKKGVPVTIAAPSALYALQSTILTGIPDATLRASIVALWNGTATAQQQQRALAYALLKLKQAGLI